MIRCAIIDLATNVVVNVIEYASVPVGAPPGLPSNTIAIASVAASPGWKWDGARLVDPAPPPPSPNLGVYATQKRWQKEVGGVLFNDIPIPTNDRAKLLILGAAQTLAENATAPFITDGVNYGVLTGAQFSAINVAIVKHVQSTFAILASVLARIDDKSITTTAEIDTAFEA